MSENIVPTAWKGFKVLIHSREFLRWLTEKYQPDMYYTRCSFYRCIGRSNHMFTEKYEISKAWLAMCDSKLRCAVASCDVRLRTHLVETCDVRACGAFLGLRFAIEIWTFFSNNVRYKDENALSFGVYKFCTSKIEPFSNLKQILVKKIHFD